jgi:hypothetical protein
MAVLERIRYVFLSRQNGVIRVEKGPERVCMNWLDQEGDSL